MMSIGAIPYLKKSWIAKSKTIHESCTSQSNTTPKAECWIVRTTWVMSFGFLIQDFLRYGIGIPIWYSNKRILMIKGKKWPKHSIRIKKTIISSLGLINTKRLFWIDQYDMFNSLNKSWYHKIRYGILLLIILEWGNPMTWKVLDWKIQYDLTSGKTIQYEAVGRVLDCSPQVRSLGFSIQQFFSLWIGIPTLYGNKLARNIISRVALKNLAQQICYHHVGMFNIRCLLFTAMLLSILYFFV